MKNAIIAFVAVSGWLLVNGLTDKLARIHDERAAYVRWARDACIPREDGQSAVMRADGGQTRCVIYERAGYGRAQVIVADATWKDALDREVGRHRR